MNKILASVGKICAAGNRVVFEPEGGYIENVTNGSRTTLRKTGMVYVLDVWAKARNPEDQIMAVDRNDKGFSWQDTLP